MVEVRDKPAKASLRLPAVLNIRFKYARMAPFIMYGHDMSRPWLPVAAFLSYDLLCVQLGIPGNDSSIRGR